MTPDQIQELLDSVELRNSPFPICLHYERSGDGFRVWYEMSVTERETGESFTSRGDMTMGHSMSREDAVAKIFNFIAKDCFLHEAKEAFHVGGKRVYDPHV